MLRPGLVSITFRDLAPAQIIELCVQAGLRSIEWGGDVHVPHGVVERADEVRGQTEAAGLAVAAYGSYYRFADVLYPDREEKGPPLEAVIETAKALGAPRIRVWAGKEGSAHCHRERRAALVEAARRAGDRAAEAGVELSFEYHDNTLTDTVESAKTLLSEIDHPWVSTFWQPHFRRSPAENREALRSVLPWVRNVHLFNWGQAGFSERHPLGEAAQEIDSYLEILQESGNNHELLLEFVRGDDPRQLMEDAKALLGRKRISRSSPESF